VYRSRQCNWHYDTRFVLLSPINKRTQGRRAAITASLLHNAPQSLSVSCSSLFPFVSLHSYVPPLPSPLVSTATFLSQVPFLVHSTIYSHSAVPCSIPAATPALNPQHPQTSTISFFPPVAGIHPFAATSVTCSEGHAFTCRETRALLSTPRPALPTLRNAIPHDSYW